MVLPATAVWIIWLISSWRKTLLFLTNWYGPLKKTPIVGRRIEREDQSIDFVAQSEIETAPWTWDTKMTQGRTQEANTELTYKTAGLNTCLRAIDKRTVMIQATDMAKDATLGRVSLENKTDRFILSHLAIAEDTIAKRYFLTVEINKRDHNHHIKTVMTSILISDAKAIIAQPGHKKHARQRD